MTEATLVPLATDLFPARVPEAHEKMSVAESDSLAAWQESPEGRAIYAALARHVRDRLGLSKGRVVSLGEGEGLFARELARGLPRAHVLGTDLCPDVVARARARHAAPNLAFEVLPALGVAARGPFDAVVSVFAFHHFEEARAALASAVAALAPGGRLFVQDLRRDALRDAFEAAAARYDAEAPAVATLFRASVRAAYTTSELRALLASVAGGRAVDVRPFRFGAGARQAFRAAHPAAASFEGPVTSIVEGLWLEAVLG